ncbi:MAG: hypothetical protein AAF968_25035 [Pseudomonadota bacterium]
MAGPPIRSAFLRRALGRLDRGRLGCLLGRGRVDLLETLLELGDPLLKDALHLLGIAPGTATKAAAPTEATAAAIGTVGQELAQARAALAAGTTATAEAAATEAATAAIGAGLLKTLAQAATSTGVAAAETAASAESASATEAATAAAIGTVGQELAQARAALAAGTTTTAEAAATEAATAALLRQQLSAAALAAHVPQPLQGGLTLAVIGV